MALRLLTTRDMTVAVLRRKLLMRGYEAATVESAVERLLRERYLDDRRYGERFVEAALTSGRYRGYRLRQELTRRGISRELTAELLNTVDDPADETALARQVVARRYGGFDPVRADERERRRIAGFLQRRGFGMATIRSVLQHNGEEGSHDG
ncbi:regulatory protein RecX [Trichlorobacter ammonificans]|uniref:Regulatory protein RecX n=1 Tax=Trichlorobacter ammonificans TaxID=2916410 RepID=A0ABM9DB10_9BACT|nr:regulatory protein RecX [Trichlorobacter ammonificans]CAH2032419.1 Regulatory protein RecX [Trichlorobacter ammonificans]